MEDGKGEQVYHAAIYVRLSKEDSDKEESDSIVNQKDFIKSFLAEKTDILICGEYVDDGYSGVNFERPNFKRMIQDIKVGQIDCVVVKDLSRLGRNFVETGRYLEQIFPSLGVRFIAINDHFDSSEGRSSFDQILIPFKNLINDAYCRDISIKIRSQLEIKRKKGDFIGSFAVYGYMKSPEDHHKLLVDDYAAGVVKEIFKWKLEGASQQRIADRLNERGELSPMEYKRFCGLAYQSGFQINIQARWTAVAVGRILCNEYYIGTLVQGKRTTPNHKVKKIIEKPYEEWIRIENHHVPVIDREDFFAVKRLLLQDTRVAPRKKEVYLFSGLVFCGDCRWNLVRNSVARNGKTYFYYICGNHRTNRLCSSHRVSNCLLEQSVFLSLRQQIAAAIDVECIFADRGRDSCYQTEVKKVERQIWKKEEEEERYRKLKNSLDKSLTDGLMDETEYLELKAIYDEKLQTVSAIKAKLRIEKERLLQNQSEGIDWIWRFRAERNLTELTRYMTVALIERIEVYEDCRMEIQFRYQDVYIPYTKLIDKHENF